VKTGVERTEPVLTTNREGTSMMATQHIDNPLSANAMDQWARRVVKRAGLWAEKSRYRRDSWDNQGGYHVFDPPQGRHRRPKMAMMSERPATQ
jgi:hypothetical protein